jgi:hypothetical protein
MSPRASFCFFDDLPLFLAVKKDCRCISVPFKSHETVKHIIESLGVPHTEIELILANGISVDFSYKPEDGDKIDVYAVNEVMSKGRVQKLQPELENKSRFVLDGHLGKLAAYLRLLGFDTCYQNDLCDEVLAEISSSDRRILLTRDRGLLKRSSVLFGYFVRETKPQKQVEEILNKFDLHGEARPFTRCVKCNGILIPVSKKEIFERLEPKTRMFYEDFHLCSTCQQVYWKGSHFKKIEQFVSGLLENNQ